MASSSNTNNPPDPLPTGWVTRTSKSSRGYVYYFHMDTGECSWERPQPEQMLQVIAEAADAVDINAVESALQAVRSTTTSATQLKKRTSDSVVDKAQSKKRSKTSEPNKVRVLHILKKHKDSRTPSSWRNPNITDTKEKAIEDLELLIEMLKEAEASGGYKELRATFEALAKAESDCSSAKRGGDLGYFGRKKMQPNFEKASFALSVGQMSSIVDTKSGVHVILRLG